MNRIAADGQTDLFDKGRHPWSGRSFARDEATPTADQ